MGTTPRSDLIIASDDPSPLYQTYQTGPISDQSYVGPLFTAVSDHSFITCFRFILFRGDQQVLSIYYGIYHPSVCLGHYNVFVNCLIESGQAQRVLSGYLIKEVEACCSIARFYISFVIL